MKYKICGRGIQEKKLIRDAFAHIYPDLLPRDVLYRRKEALSDGVSSIEDSWYKKIQKKYENERSFYLETFEKYCDPHSYGYAKTILPHYWMPRFVKEIQDPSAREFCIE
jgi:asparagine synthase (glutamine-hydrolysing)